MVAGLREDALPAGVGGESGGLESIGGPDHFEGLRADRSGRSEYQHSLHGAQCRWRPKRPVKRSCSPETTNGRPEGLPFITSCSPALADLDRRELELRDLQVTGRL